MFKNLVIIFIAGLIFAGCNFKDTVKIILERSYAVVCDSENVINSTDTTNFVAISQVIDTSLGFVNTGLVYIDAKMTNQQVKDAIEKAIVSIVKVRVALKDITIENIEITKSIVMDSMENIKSTLVTIGKYLGVEFSTVAVANVDPLKKLKISTDSLSAELTLNKK